MKMQVFPKMFISKLRVLSFISVLLPLSLLFAAEPPLRQIISKISELPSSVYSPEAYAYYSGKGVALAEQPSAADITQILTSMIRLTANKSDAKEIIPVLIASYPKAVHVTSIRNIKYTGEGTFSDWVYTYIASEKNKFILASPFLDYNSMSLFEQFVETSHEVALPSGEVVTSPTRELVTITVTHTLYPAAYVLTVLTGELIICMVS